MSAATHEEIFTISNPPVKSVDLTILSWIFGGITALFGPIAASTALMLAASGRVLEGLTLATLVTGVAFIAWFAFTVMAHSNRE